MGEQLMAIVAAGKNTRIYLAPTAEHEAIAKQAQPVWKPEQELAGDRRAIYCPLYGFNTIGDLFTSRQLVSLNALSDLIGEVGYLIEQDAATAKFPTDEVLLTNDNNSFTAYAAAVVTYLAIAIDRLTDRNSTVCSWDVTRDSMRNTFARQAIPMVWDFAEANPFSESTGNFLGAIDWVAEVVQQSPCYIQGEARQHDAMTTVND